jgi:hypothetical protein
MNKDANPRIIPVKAIKLPKKGTENIYKRKHTLLQIPNYRKSEA